MTDPNEHTNMCQAAVKYDILAKVMYAKSQHKDESADLRCYIKNRIKEIDR